MSDTSDSASPETTPSDVLTLHAWIRNDRQREKAADEKVERVVEVIASTDAEDRWGDSIEQVWRLDAYRANPVVLYAHDSRALPIGGAENVRVEDGALRATLRFVDASVNPEAEKVWQSIQAGVLRAVSVGFIPHSYRWEKRDDREILVLSDNELVEISVVPVPANPEALMRMRRKALAARAVEAPADPARQELATRAAQAEARVEELTRAAAAKAEADERASMVRDGLAARTLVPAHCAPGAWALTTPLAELKSYLACAVPILPPAGARREAGPVGAGALGKKSWGDLTPIEKDRLYREAPEVYDALKSAHDAAKRG